ncbi:cdkn1a interacting zinc finger protein 1a [Garra rufa]|uniref:cdkn1a interacting zinc finger protein 1a n=1 Tax=Garra rufa TaxID=137080 RepID=UPI003CCE87D6
MHMPDVRMFNPHQQQQQFHQHLRQLQQLFQQQTPPPPPPPPPPPQPPPAHHITHARPIAVQAPAPPPARMVNLCSATQTIIAPNPMLQGALLMQQMQAGGMRGFAMGGQQFPQFFTAGSRASLLGPVPMGVAIKTPHMGFQRHFTPHTRYFTNEFQARQPDRKRENEQKSVGSSESQSEARSSRADEAPAAANPGCKESSEQPDEPVAKKQKTQESEEPVETESAQSAECKSPDPAELTLQEGGGVDGPLPAEADEPSQVAEQVESTEAPDKDVEQQNSDVPDDAVVSDPVPEIKETTVTPEEVKDGAAETSNKFFCYICNITCHNQQNFQSHMNGLTHQQKMMEIQHMSNACLVTLLPRVQESLQRDRKDGEKRPGLQRWCSTCQTHFTSNVMDHRRTKEHKRCSRPSSTNCTVCKVHFRTPREFVEHMQSTEHKQRVEQLWKESGKEGADQLNADMLLGDEDGECSDDEREDEENGKEGLSAQMEVTLEDLTEDEEFDSDTVYGSSFVVPVAGFLCRLCNQFYHFESSARHAHCKTLKHFENLKHYKALKKHEDSGSTSGEPADHTSPDETSLIPKPALQTSQSSSSTSHLSISISRLNASSSAQEDQTPAQEEAVAGEPEEEDEAPAVPEGKGARGRGRTPAKRRGRGGRRR